MLPVGKILSTYKLNLLISLTLSIVIIALRVEKNPVNIGLIVLGALIGSFVLKLEYFMYAYWNEPNASFSESFKEFIKAKNYQGLIAFVEVNKYDLHQRILHSVLFQVLLAFTALYLVTSSGIFGAALVLSTLVQSFYEMYTEHEDKHTSTNWFWILKQTPSKKFQIGYVFAMGLFLIYILTLVR